MIEDSRGDIKKENYIEQFIEKHLRFLTEDDTCPVTETNLTSIIQGMGVYLFGKPNSFPNEISPDYIRKDFNRICKILIYLSILIYLDIYLCDVIN